MSYPPRPPMGMGPMPGGMFGYAPMGMMPMGMGMMPMMRPTMMQQHQMMQQQQQQQQRQQQLVQVPRPPIKRLLPEPNKEEKPPLTTVFVGNISEKAPDAMIRQMLQRCGNVMSWRRVQGASGKLQGFGFCEYEDPEATLRCMRLLNEWQIGDKQLLVKVDAKTKSLLDEHNAKKLKAKADAAAERKKKAEKSAAEEKEEGEEVSSGGEEGGGDEVDEMAQREDRVARAGLDAIMKEYEGDLARESASDRKDRERPRTQAPARSEGGAGGGGDRKEKPLALDNVEIEEDKKDQIHREIRNFRDAHKEEEDKRRAERDGEREKEREREREIRRRRDEERDRERERERNREREREREERTRIKEKERERERERERPVIIRDDPKSRSKTRERSTERGRERGGGERDGGGEDEEEQHERRKLERRLREKEAAYQELLKRWETRETKKGREYKKETDKETERKSEEAKETRRLKEFLEDYDDDRDDIKYYKGSALQRRLNDREKEMEADERDRQKEKEELEEIRRRLLDEGHPDPDAEMAKIERQREEHLMPRFAAAHHSPSGPMASRTRTPSPAPISDDDVVPLDDDDVIPMSHWTPAPANPAPPKPVAPPARQPEPSYSSSPEYSPFEGGANSNAALQEEPIAQAKLTTAPEPAIRKAAAEEEEPMARNVGAGLADRDESMERQQFAAPPSMSDDSMSGFSNTYTPTAVTAPAAKMEGAAGGAGGVGAPAGASKSRLGFSGLKLGVSEPGAAGTQSPSAASGADSAAAAAAAEKKRKKLSVEDVFNTEEDEDPSAAKKRRLVPLIYSAKERAAVLPSSAVVAAQAAAAALNVVNKPTTAEEKRKCIKNLIERIPTAKDELFAYKLDWTMVDSTLMERRIKPWVNKKIVEYIGEDEPTLSEFICKKVIANSTPDTILADISMVLDDEAEVFVVKMWRLLIYETEAKKLGLVK